MLAFTNRTLSKHCTQKRWSFSVPHVLAWAATYQWTYCSSLPWALRRSLTSVGGFKPNFFARFHRCILVMPQHGPNFQSKSNCRNVSMSALTSAGDARLRTLASLVSTALLVPLSLDSVFTGDAAALNFAFDTLEGRALGAFADVKYELILAVAAAALLFAVLFFDFLFILLSLTKEWRRFWLVSAQDRLDMQEKQFFGMNIETVLLSDAFGARSSFYRGLLSMGLHWCKKIIWQHGFLRVCPRVLFLLLQHTSEKLLVCTMPQSKRNKIGKFRGSCNLRFIWFDILVFFVFHCSNTIENTEERQRKKDRSYPEGKMGLQTTAKVNDWGI